MSWPLQKYNALSSVSCLFYMYYYYSSTSSFAIKKSRFDFADELKIGDIRYDNMT